MPDGLVLDTDTGGIFGTPATPQAATSRTITASNVNGEDTFALQVEVVDGDLSGLAYSKNPASYTIDEPIHANVLALEGTPHTFSSSPPLPSGLQLDATTGIITGTPEATGGPSDYEITATSDSNSERHLVDSDGERSTNGPELRRNPFRLPPQQASHDGRACADRYGNVPRHAAFRQLCRAGNEPQRAHPHERQHSAHGRPPANLSYASGALSLTAGVTGTTGTPGVQGDALAFGVSPALRAGVSINAGTGEFSGTPQASRPATMHTVTATNVNGIADAVLTLTIAPPPAPTSTSYATSAMVFTQNVAGTSGLATTNAPRVTYGISPALPTGLSLNPTAGEVSGMPPTRQSATSYTVTATNESGSSNVVITIEVVP